VSLHSFTRVEEEKKTCHSSWTARHGIDTLILIEREGKKNSNIFSPCEKKEITHTHTHTQKLFFLCVTFFFLIFDPFWVKGAKSFLQ
jgi:hypothetical protein